MSFLELLAIGFGGFLGAVIRYFIATKMNEFGRFPFGTILVNLAGSLLIGIVFGADLSRIWTLFLASGLAGALTTFSTLNKEVIELWQGGKRMKTMYYVLITFSGGISLAMLGYYLSSN
ncbi:CrcB family protein [Sporosarcina sp. Marseille-Q4063]|uniref:fluoride efflux transporter FluC n=1 Tax=Sporosarcina sp. Marseille-Q4063 TaxID=2810514 RepID=UPI001BAF49B8|nr:CrcB family protein [Sporosarcina sp. Marseille-Q4063]QUW23198.1 CrcB family protein [Sporosarcina sp. Marseille-Q4063]